MKTGKEALRNSVRERHIIYIMILCIFFIAVFFLKLNFSSMDAYRMFLNENISQSQSVQLGETRMIRSDEWGVLTPLQFSQYYNNWSLSSRMLGAESNISAVSGGVPTKSLSILGKPVLWGYLLFGLEIGCSWYHVSKLFLLIIFSFLLLELLTNNKKASLIGSGIIALSPGIQWWLTTNALVTESIIYFEMIIVSFCNLFMKKNSLKMQIISGVLLMISLIGFVLVLYPAVQVPLVYLGVLLAGGIYLDNKNEYVISSKRIFIFFISFIFAGVIILIDGLKMAPDYLKILDTVYPGKRFVSGGNLSIIDLFKYIVVPMLPFKEVTFSNSSEVSSFFTLFPLVWVSLNWSKKKEYVIKVIFGFCLWCLIFMLIGIPNSAAKYTLWSFVAEERLLITFGYASTLLICCIAGRITNSNNDIKLTAQNLIFMGLVFLIVYQHSPDFQGYILKDTYMAFLVLFLLLIYLFIEKKEEFLVAFLLLTVISGATVNPIHFGIDVMTDTVFADTVRKINDEETGKWITIDDLWISKYLLAQGIETVNALNYPPKLEEWSSVDSGMNNVEIYNRYAHVKVILNEKAEEKFELIQGDVFQVSLTDADIRRLNIRYVVSKNEIVKRELLQELCVVPEDNIHIYKVIY